MKKEAVDEAASEAIRQAEQDKAWRKREEVWEKEKAARDKLMKDVMKARREQLESKLAHNRAERLAALEERAAKLDRENIELRAGARWPEWIAGGSILLVGGVLGMAVHASSARRQTRRIRL